MKVSIEEKIRQRTVVDLTLINTPIRLYVFVDGSVLIGYRRRTFLPVSSVINRGVSRCPQNFVPSFSIKIKDLPTLIFTLILLE